MYKVKTTWYSGPIVDNWDEKYFTNKDNAEAYYNALLKKYGKSSEECTFYMDKIETSDHEIEQLVSDILSVDDLSDPLHEYRLQS